MLVLVVALGLVAGAPARPAGRAVPDTFSALKAELPNDRGRKLTALLRFASDDAPAVPDRLRATQAARALMAGDERKKVEAWLLDAELSGAIGKGGPRRGALNNARASARRLDMSELVMRIEEVMRGDDALALLTRAVAKGKPAEVRALDAAKRSLAAWLAIGDERTHGLARMWITLAEPTELEHKLSELADAADALGTARLHAGARAEVLLARARLLESAGRLGEAARERVQADRERDVNLKRSGLEPSARAPYLRSKETAAACKTLRSEKNTCAREEERRFGARSFYDFSQEKLPTLDPQRAEDVIIEYESTLQRCLAEGAKANLTTQTHVELEWGVGNDGRVKGLDLRPMRLRGTVVETCMKEAFSLWRYPRYGGEMQHVRLDFNVEG
jgi:hypothetical protein